MINGDWSKLTDEELQSRLMKAREYLNQAHMAGHYTLIHSVEITLAQLEEEYEYRMTKARNEQLTKENMAKGIDPLAPINLGKVSGDPTALDRITKRNK